jgi:predicted HicB family RNase H-like nuclease
MMIDGKKAPFYTRDLIVRVDADLRSQLAATAERERVSMSEFVRRAVRSALAGQVSANEEHRQPC